MSLNYVAVMRSGRLAFIDALGEGRPGSLLSARSLRAVKLTANDDELTSLRSATCKAARTLNEYLI